MKAPVEQPRIVATPAAPRATSHETPSLLRIRLLGPLRLTMGGVEMEVPRSRKLGVLLAYLSLAGAPKTRARLCDLLWAVPSDPRGELRWYLSRLRALLDEDGRRRVVTSSPSLVALDLSDCEVDALAVDRLARADLRETTIERLSEAADLFSGDLLDGLTVDGPELAGWLSAQRHRYRSLHVAILGELVRRLPATANSRLDHLQDWLALAPFDPQAHAALLETLVRSGRQGEAQAHLDRTIHVFEHEGVDWAPLRAAFLAARVVSTDSLRVTAIEEERCPSSPDRPSRPGSVLVTPLREASQGLGQVAHGLTDELITRLAKLRVLFVIARGTAYALSERGLDAREAAGLLDVEYVVSGVVRREGGKLFVHLELAHSRNAGIVWAERIDDGGEESMAVLDATIDRLVAAIAEQIEQAECKRALAKPPSSLDAWQAYHRGLWHMYRFTETDNQMAQDCFRSAVTLDATFARAHAGLSFTHFQNVFLNLRPEREQETLLALEGAHRSVAADDRDPAAHWAMGRALWLAGEAGEALAELERSVELSPSFALGHYTVGFVHSQSGDPHAAIAASDTSRALSPFDPLQFAMLARRALAHLRLDQHEEAAAWAVKAAARPNAHVHILAIAATALALTRRREQAGVLIARIRRQLPRYDIEEFLRAFRFTPEAERLFRRAARPMGFA